MQTTKAQTPNRLHCIGVGDGWPTLSRNHSAFYYEVEGNHWLVDCGESVSTGLKIQGIGPDVIDRIFISHLHGDHIGGFLMLMQGLWLEKRRRELKIHLPVDGIEPLRALMQAGCLFEELFPFKLEFLPLEANRVVTTTPGQITPFATTHLDSLKQTYQGKYPLRFEAFSFLMKTPQCTIAHTADLGEPDDLETLLSNHVDLLVCELAHFSPEVLFRDLSQRNIERLVLVHLSLELWENQDDLLALAKETLPNTRVYIPKDRDIIPF